VLKRLVNPIFNPKPHQTLIHSIFFPQCVFVCFVWFSAYTVIVSLNSINRLPITLAMETEHVSWGQDNVVRMEEWRYSPTILDLRNTWSDQLHPPAALPPEPIEYESAWTTEQVWIFWRISCTYWESNHSCPTRKLSWYWLRYSDFCPRG
jgi:hypothetical protein